MPTVTFLPWNKSVEVDEGTDLLMAAAAAGVPVEGTCGGKGSCGKCKVRLISGQAAAPTPAEIKHLSATERENGWILACQRKAADGMILEVVPPQEEHRRKSRLQGAAAEIEVEPSLEKYAVTLPPPSVHDQLPDWERLQQKLPRRLRIDRRLLSALPRLLREARFKVTAVTAGERLVAVEAGDTTDCLYGLAFDIGTTTIMGALLNLRTGETVNTAATTNPQNVYGADVISRISYASREGGLGQLQQKVLEAANGIIRELLLESGLNREQIYEAVVVGNTTMSHLFLGVDPTYLAPAPFVPAFRQAIEVEAADLGLEIHPAGRVVILPNIAGYVGSDTLGVLLATRLDERQHPTLAVDIGTNGELALAAGGRLLTCSTAAGPAFEGAEIRHGMRAAAGAIERVIINEDVELKTIGDAPPRGICGSGLIDIVAELLKAGLMDSSGRLLSPQQANSALPPRLQERLRRGAQGMEFVLAFGEESAGGEDIVISQKDLRELQLAKGAIYAGANILLKQLGLQEADLAAVLLAGAFGNYIRRESALAIGLLPEVPPERVIPVGNAAGDGARMALLSKRERERAFSLVEKAEHIELSTRADFQQEFIRALNFKN